MAARRPIYRKEQPRSISKTGLLLCLLLAGGVMVVPLGGDAVHAGKLRLRDWALNSGLIDFKDCMVTSAHTLDCSRHATGTPLPVALRQIEDNAAAAAAEKEQRLKAEKKARALALDIERLDAQLKQARRAVSPSDFFAPSNGEIRPTGLTVTNPSTGDMMSTTAAPQSAQPAPDFSLTPPGPSRMKPDSQQP